MKLVIVKKNHLKRALTQYEMGIITILDARDSRCDKISTGTYDYDEIQDKFIFKILNTLNILNMSHPIRIFLDNAEVFISNEEYKKAFKADINNIEVKLKMELGNVAAGILTRIKENT